MSRPVLLVLRALGLGDLLTAVPALRALAEAFPGHERVLATPASLATFALGLGLSDRVLCARPLAPVAWSGGPIDLAVNLHGRGPESHAVLRALGPRRTIAFAHAGAPGSSGSAGSSGTNRSEGPAWRAEEHEVARWCRLLVESGVPADPARLEIAAPRGAPPAAARGATLLHPGAASAARRWPAPRWSAVAAALAAGGHAVVITGGPDEVGLAHEVARGAGLGERAVLAGRTSLMDLARAVGAAARVVCGDTGVAHLATALGRPSVILFGPTPPALWGPPADRPWHRALWAGMSGDPHADEPHEGLLRLRVEDVLEALSTLPGAPGGKPLAGRDGAVSRGRAMEYGVCR